MRAGEQKIGDDNMENEKPLDVPEEWKNKTECELREIGVGMYERGEDIVDIVHYIFTRFGTFIEGDEFEAVIFNKTSEKKIMARVNLGTYPVGQAKSVARIMRRMKNNKNVSFAKPVNVVLRGRGKRWRY